MGERIIAFTIMGGPDNTGGKQVIVYGNAAKKMAHLGRIDADLQAAKKRCDLYLAELALDREQSADILGAMSESAFLAYARGADGAGGSYPPELIDALTPEQKATHQWARDVRDKYAGHSVNALNQTMTTANLVESEAGVEVVAVFAVNTRAILGREDIEDLSAQIDAMRGALAPLIESARQAVIDEVGPVAADSLGNSPLQLDIVSRDTFDYFSNRPAEVRGKIEIPAVLETRTYGEQ